LRQAYDYWQDQPGSCLDSRAGKVEKSCCRNSCSCSTLPTTATEPRKAQRCGSREIEALSVEISTQSRPCFALLKKRTGPNCSCHEASLIVLPALKTSDPKAVPTHQRGLVKSTHPLGFAARSHLAPLAMCMLLSAGRATALASE
jgi:hypothetical protein